MKKSIAVSIAATAGLAVSFATQAADLGTAPVYRAPPPVALTWSSCYLGANAGGGWAKASISDPISNTSVGDIAHSSLAGGGQFGCDYQVGLFVFGFQGMVDAVNIRGSGVQPNGLVLNNFK